MPDSLRRADSEREREVEKARRIDAAKKREHAEHDGHEQRPGDGAEQDQAAVGHVGERAGRQREHEERERGGGLHQRHHECGRRQGRHHPRGTGRVHPRADVREEQRDPERAEHRIAQRRPGGRVAGGRSFGESTVRDDAHRREVFPKRRAKTSRALAGVSVSLSVWFGAGQ